MSFRAAKFWLLRRIVVPLASVPVWWWVRSWRAVKQPDAELAALVAPPRVIIATYHGMILHLLAFEPVMRNLGRELVVFVSPSRDGELMADVLRKLGVHAVRGSSRSRAIAGSLEFLRALETGKVGLITTDGPRGPVFASKPGIIRLAESCGATVLMAVTSAERGHMFRSWDRMHLPWPRARVEVRVRPFADPGGGDEAARLAALDEQMTAFAREVGNPSIAGWRG